MSYHAKTLLYVYSGIEEAIDIIDEMVYRKAMGSFADTSPCEKQAENILQLISEKDELIFLKTKMDEVLSEFSETERLHFEYKYFNNKPKEYYKDINTSARAYFRTQHKLLSELEKKLALKGVTEEYFFSNLYNIPFVKSCYHCVVHSEDTKKTARTDTLKKLQLAESK